MQETPGAQLHPALERAKVDIVIDKGQDPNSQGYSGFQDTELADLLRERGVARLYVGGLATDFCVKNTVLDARGLGLDVAVIEDTIAGVDVNPGDSERAVEEMKGAPRSRLRTRSRRRRRRDAEPEMTKGGALGRWWRKKEGQRAGRQEGNAHALDREGDPRGGIQSEAYRLADPRELIEEDGVVMGAPGGAPQEGKTVEERRRQDRPKHPGGRQDSDVGPRPSDHRLDAPREAPASPGLRAGTGGGFPTRPMDAIASLGGVFRALRRVRR